MKTLRKQRMSEAYRLFRERYIGDDLSELHLDELLDWVDHNEYGDHEHTTSVAGWYQDKPHQVVRRLILRLTRAEAKNEQNQKTK